MTSRLNSFGPSRRRFLQSAGAGFGMVSLAGALQSAGAASSGLHLPARAKRVIYLFMNGGPSHVDTFDPKPALAKFEGEMPSDELHKKPGAGYKSSPFSFAKHGESGLEISELFPHIARFADDLCVIRSMHTDTPNHEPGLLMMQSGVQQPTRPSLGSWASYGLGTENENLPSFVVLCPGLPVVGPQLWSASFLPGEHQGVSIDTHGKTPEELVAHLRHSRFSRTDQRRQLDLLARINRLHADARGGDQALESQIHAMELAFAMQREATDVFDLSREPAHVAAAYGDSVFARSCLLGRRLLEHGVRFVQVYYVDKKNKQPWDTHTDNDGGHRRLAADADRATAALLADLKARGMLEDTLVLWGGEFGRTPYAQVDKKKPDQKPGRDHHHTGFSLVAAGGGVRGGLAYGATDEFGMNAIEDRVHVHDLHATILHLLGVDHTRLTYRYSGRDFRLTDVHGRVVDGILA